MPERARRVASTVALVLLLAACSNDSTGIELEPGPTSETTAPTSSSTPSTTESVADAGELEAAWIAMWDGAELVVSDRDRAKEAITSVASTAVYEQLDVLYNPSITDASVENTPRSFDNNPVLAEQPDGTYVIDDCLFETPKVGNKTIWYRGGATLVDGRWQIGSLELVNQNGCVPQAVAEAAFQGYDDYWDARLEFWDPADPDHPLVAETLAPPQLGFIRDLLAEHEAEGLTLRGRHTSHYEIIEVRSPDELAIRDCLDQDLGRGVFDIDSGERLDLIPPIVDGQRDFLSAVMLLEGGRWKVSDVQAQRRAACEYPPSAQGLPVV